ncbi:hypothetical protein HK096_010587, partial [Nowakowskiella sp. JEL0078]
DFFKSMSLFKDCSDKTLKQEVLLPKILTSEAIQPILSYLYAAILPELSNCSITTVIAILQAGDFLVLPVIVEHVILHLHSRRLLFEDFHEAAISMKTVRPGAEFSAVVFKWFAEGISQELEINSKLKTHTLKEFDQNMVEIVLMYSPKNLDALAKLFFVKRWLKVHNLIDHVGTTSSNISFVSKADSGFDSDSGDRTEIVKSESEFVGKVVETSPKSKETCLTPEGQKIFGDLLSEIQLNTLDSSTMETVVEPLQLLTQKQLLDLYREYSRSSGVSVRSSIVPDGSKILMFCPTELHSTSLVKFRFKKIYRFSVNIIKNGNFTWVGVANDTINMNEWAGRQSGGWVFGSNGYLCHDTQMSNGPYETRYGREWGIGTKIEVTVNMNDRTVAYKINDDDFGVAFSGLPDDPVFPCFSCNHLALATFEFIED